MFDSLVDFFTNYPYFGVLLIFMLCGLGLPLPEEIVLMAAGFMCYSHPEVASVHWMIVACAVSILIGDAIPYALGRTFGTRLLRLRPLRMLVTRDRLATFDKWFSKRGDMVIFIARFLPGIRVVAFFTAGTMKMTLRRFLFLDGLGIVMLVPLLVYLPYRFGAAIEDVVRKVQTLERGILWTAVGAIAIAGLWWWLRRRRARKAAAARPADTFIEPSEPIGPRLPVEHSAAPAPVEPLPTTEAVEVPDEPPGRAPDSDTEAETPQSEPDGGPRRPRS